MAFTATQSLDAAASTVSRWIDFRTCLSASITIVVPAGPVGTFTLEGTDDTLQVTKEGYHGDPTASTAAYAAMDGLYDASASPAPSGSAVTYILQLAVPPAFLRLRYTRASGSGTVPLHFTGR